MPLINQTGKEKSIEHRLNRYTLGPFAGILEVATARSLLSHPSIPGETASVAPTHTFALRHRHQSSLHPHVARQQRL